MRFFVTSIAFVFGALFLFIAGVFLVSPVIMLSVMCLILPAAMWINGYATSKAGIRLQANDEPAQPARQTRGNTGAANSYR